MLIRIRRWNGLVVIRLLSFHVMRLWEVGVTLNASSNSIVEICISVCWIFRDKKTYVHRKNQFVNSFFVLSKKNVLVKILSAIRLFRVFLSSEINALFEWRYSRGNEIIIKIDNFLQKYQNWHDRWLTMMSYILS